MEDPEGKATSNLPKKKEEFGDINTRRGEGQKGRTKPKPKKEPLKLTSNPWQKKEGAFGEGGGIASTTIWNRGSIQTGERGGGRNLEVGNIAFKLGGGSHRGVSKRKVQLLSGEYEKEGGA